MELEIYKLRPMPVGELCFYNSNSNEFYYKSVFNYEKLIEYHIKFNETILECDSFNEDILVCLAFNEFVKIGPLNSNKHRTFKSISCVLIAPHFDSKYSNYFNYCLCTFILEMNENKTNINIRVNKVSNEQYIVNNYTLFSEKIK